VVRVSSTIILVVASLHAPRDAKTSEVLRSLPGKLVELIRATGGGVTAVLEGDDEATVSAHSDVAAESAMLASAAASAVVGSSQ